MRPRRLKSEINVVPYIDVMLVLLVIFMVATPMMTGTALEVKIDADESLFLIDRAGDGKEQPVTRKALRERVLALQVRNPDQPVLIVGNKNVKYEAVLQVMDELKRAEIKTVSLLVQPPGK